MMPDNGAIVVNKTDASMSTRSVQSSEEPSQVKIRCSDEKGTGHWEKDWVVVGIKIAPNSFLVGRVWFSFQQDHLLQHEEGIGVTDKRRFGSCP